MAGYIYLVCEPPQPHELISGNVFAAWHAHLRGKPYRPYAHNTRVHIRAREDDYFHYPDIGLALPLGQIYEGLP